MAGKKRDVNYVAGHEGEAKQFRWSKSMNRFLVEFLVEQAKMGNKVDKNFRKTSFTQAASAVSKEFNLICHVDNVENRMKTIKKDFKQIKMIERNNSGMSWNNDQKMWNCSEDVYREFVRVHPKAEQYLNKPIPMYDELCIICGDDQATGIFAKSGSDDTCDFDTESEIGIEDIEPANINTPVNTRSLASPPIRKHGRKRVRYEDNVGEKLDNLAKSVDNMANAMKSQVDTELLYSEVMKMEGFDELLLEAAFDYLNENDTIARSFMVKNVGGRTRWLKKYEEDFNA